MQNPRLAAVYAKSLADVAVEKNRIDTVYTDMEYIKNICEASRDFVLLMKSPIIFPEKKEAIFQNITKGKISDLTAVFVSLLIKKGREKYLSEIIPAFINEYNKRNGITVVKITTATPLTGETKNGILQKLKTAGIDKVKMQSATNENLIGGFVLEYNNNLVDASVARDLRNIKKQFRQNIYIPNIR